MESLQYRRPRRFERQKSSQLQIGPMCWLFRASDQEVHPSSEQHTFIGQIVEKRLDHRSKFCD
jgi:hypothetical protein